MASKVIGFRVTPDEEELLEALSKATGLTASDVIRALLHQAEVRPAVVLRRDLHIVNAADDHYVWNLVRIEEEDDGDEAEAGDVEDGDLPGQL